MEKGGWRLTFWVCHSAIHGQTRFSLACCPHSSWIWVRPHSHAKNKGCLGCPKLLDPATADLTPVWPPIVSLKFGEFNHSIKISSIPRGFTYISKLHYSIISIILPGQKMGDPSIFKCPQVNLALEVPVAILRPYILAHVMPITHNSLPNAICIIRRNASQWSSAILGKLSNFLIHCDSRLRKFRGQEDLDKLGQNNFRLSWCI